MAMYQGQNDGWSTPPYVGQKLNNLKHELGGTPLKVTLLATTRDDLRGEKAVTLPSIGFSVDFLQMMAPRTFRINVHTGFPCLESGRHPESIEFGIKGEIISYTVLASDPEPFTLVCVGTTEQTFYLVLNGGRKGAFFYTAFPSYHGRHAIRGLLHYNLLNGPHAYARTASLIPSFFKRALAAVYTKPSVIRVTASVLKGAHVERYQEYTTKYHLNPRQPNTHIISIEGYCFDVDLDEYPKQQLVAIDRWARNNTPEKRKERMAHREASRRLRQLEHNA